MDGSDLFIYRKSSADERVCTNGADQTEGSSGAVALVNASTANGYTKGMSGYTTNASDNVFSDGVSNETSVITCSVSTGFALTHTIIVSA